MDVLFFISVLSLWLISISAMKWGLEALFSLQMLQVRPHVIKQINIWSAVVLFCGALIGFFYLIFLQPVYQEGFVAGLAFYFMIMYSLAFVLGGVSFIWDAVSTNDTHMKAMRKMSVSFVIGILGLVCILGSFSRLMSLGPIIMSVVLLAFFGALNRGLNGIGYVLLPAQAVLGKVVRMLSFIAGFLIFIAPIVFVIGELL